MRNTRDTRYRYLSGQIMRYCGFILLFGAILLSHSCSLGSLGGVSIADPSIRQNSNETGDVELIIDPINAWDEKGAGQEKLYTVNGKELHFRLKDVSFTDKAWIRVGLFWHSRAKKVMVPVVALGPPVKIKKIQFIIDGSRRISPRKAKDFTYTPNKQLLDKNVSTNSFEIKLEQLKKIVEAKNVTLILATSRGNLVANLSVVTKDDERSLQKSVKYLFVDFYDQINAVLSEKS